MTGENKGGQTSGQTSQEPIEQVYLFIKENPQITRKQLAKAINKAPSAIQKYIEKLKADKRIKRVGPSTFGGYWEVIS